MNIIDNIANYIQKINKKEFEKLLLIILLITSVSSLGAIYYIYNSSSSLVLKIKEITKLANKTTSILNENKKMDYEQDRLTKILEVNKNFSIKTFFEQFCQQQGIPPESNWDTITVPVEGNEKLDEIILTANFKNQTTSNLTRMLENLDKNEMVYIKELIINHESNKKISFKITIATKRLKTF